MIAHHFRNVNEFRRWKVFYIEQQYTRSFSVEFIHQFLFWCGFAWNVSIFLFEMIPYIFLCAVLLILCSDKILLIISRRYTKIGWLIFFPILWLSWKWLPERLRPDHTKKYRHMFSLLNDDMKHKPSTLLYKLNCR